MEPGDMPTNQTDGRIVISYRRDDAAGYAGRLDDDLGDYFGDNQVFRDLDQIDAGTQWFEVISRAIERASAVIVVIGPQWAGNPRLKHADDVVRHEVAQALSRGKPVFPVLVGNAQMPNTAVSHRNSPN
ncbi:toll/interleukin-1 receptor domain-containing protein [Mycobacterium sp. CPCC 205710]|uniref:Toll/interleukin-1 receptor domain-containing protein n=2 Tax=Mycobacterium deserti TaxID=2978347 RepID=A0ABT2M702_9MYCO|nr:toll/interleukin-1 receptor domain-containing protein [Mycobacterium deserti]